MKKPALNHAVTELEDEFCAARVAAQASAKAADDAREKAREARRRFKKARQEFKQAKKAAKKLAKLARSAEEELMLCAKKLTIQGFNTKPYRLRGKRRDSPSAATRRSSASAASQCSSARPCGRPAASQK
jgi:hypothetical protein